MNQDILKEVLDDLLSRFILNCPEEEHVSFERLFFQIEEAYWFYEDFYLEKYKKYNLQHLTFKQFSELLFQHCSLLRPYKASVSQYLGDFHKYKNSVKVCGAILLNKSMDKVLLVKGYNSKSWGFPKGKINKNEEEKNCAIREVKEETGYDISEKLDEKDFIECSSGKQMIKLFIIKNVSEEFLFKPETRKEIFKVEFHDIEEIINQQIKLSPYKTPIRPKSPPTFLTPKKFIGTEEIISSPLLLNMKDNSPKKNIYRQVSPFMRKLKLWIEQKEETNKRNKLPLKNLKKSVTYFNNNNNNVNITKILERNTNLVNNGHHLRKRSRTYHNHHHPTSSIPSFKAGRDINNETEQQLPFYNSQRSKSLLNFSFNANDILSTSSKISV